MAIKKDEYHIKLGLKLRFERNKKNLSQERFSELAHLSKTYIGQIERGECSPTIEALNKIAEALGIKLTELVNVEKVDL